MALLLSWYPTRVWLNDVQDITDLSLQEARKAARNLCKWRQKSWKSPEIISDLMAQGMTQF